MFLVAVVGAGIIGLTGGIGFFEALEGPYMEGFTNFTKSWAIVIALGALLGGLYSKSGAAWRIGDTLIKKAGAKMALLIYVIVGAALVYCGITVPVTIFVLLPFAKVIFPKANIPWSLFPGVTGLAIATFGMYLPGSLQVINLIPTSALNVPATAAPFEGVVASVFMLVVGMLYITWEIKRTSVRLGNDVPELYLSDGNESEDSDMDATSPKFIISLIPVVLTLILVNIIKLDMIFSFGIGCAVALILFWKNIPDKANCISQGFNDGIMPCILVSAVVGLGSVIAVTPVFEVIRDSVIRLPLNGLAKVAAVTTIVSGICASGAGGVQLTMDLFGQQFISWGFPADILARVAAIACGGLDSMPWNGTVVMMFTLSGVGYNKGYKSVAVLTVLLPILASLVAVLMYSVRIGIFG